MATIPTIELPLTGARRSEVVLLLGALTAFAPLSIDMYLPALPTLQQYFNASEGDGRTALHDNAGTREVIDA